MHSCGVLNIGNIRNVAGGGQYISIPVGLWRSTVRPPANRIAFLRVSVSRVKLNLHPRQCYYRLPPATHCIVEPHCGHSAVFEVEAGRAFLDQKSKECIPSRPSPAGTVPPTPKTTANGRDILTTRAKYAMLWPEEVYGHVAEPALCTFVLLSFDAAEHIVPCA